MSLTSGQRVWPSSAGCAWHTHTAPPRRGYTLTAGATVSRRQCVVYSRRRLLSPWSKTKLGAGAPIVRMLFARWQRAGTLGSALSPHTRGPVDGLSHASLTPSSSPRGLALPLSRPRTPYVARGGRLGPPRLSVTTHLAQSHQLCARRRRRRPRPLRLCDASLARPPPRDANAPAASSARPRSCIRCTEPQETA